MRLRLKLFVYIGCTFVAISLASYILQEFFTDMGLREAKQELTQSILKSGKARKERQEENLTSNIDDDRAWINAMLLRVRDFPPLRMVFDPDSDQFLERSWLDSATMLANQKDLDLVEIEFENSKNSVMVLPNADLPQVEIQNITRTLQVILPPKHTGLGNPLVVIPLHLSEILRNDSHVAITQEDQEADFYVVFEPETVTKNEWDIKDFSSLTLTVNPLEPYMQWIERKGPNILFTAFVEELNAAKEQIIKYPNLMTEEFVEKHFKPALWKPRDFIQQDKALEYYYIKNQVLGMTWGFATLITSGPFDNTPFSKKAPIGIIRTKKGEKNGIVLLRDRVFKSSDYIKESENKVKKRGYQFENSLNVILPKTRDSYFIGNTLQLQGEKGDFKITIGTSGPDFLKWMSLAIEELTVLVVDKEVIDANKFGQSVHLDFSQDPTQLQHMLSNDIGQVIIKGQKYFFTKLVPKIPGNYHFYSLTPWEKEFFLVQNLDQGTRALVREITWKLALTALGAMAILLFLLDRIGAKITGPISMLAHATKKVQEGKLDEVQLPKMKRISKDEVSILSHAFSEMVQGLKEKERVRGVLNKVVSQEIADEILKSDVHLGGEEKDVTVFFADIRGFTALTEKMPAQDVVTLLNECMTRVSSVIDKRGGVIDKYVGDEVMALFGAPIEKETACLDAIIAALEVIGELAIWNEKRLKENKPKVEMGFGIHIGPMVVGNMGAEDRLNYTVMGANVNLCSRLCSIAKTSEIVISESVLKAKGVKEKVIYEPIDPVTLKGFTEDIKLFHVTGLKS